MTKHRLKVLFVPAWYPSEANPVTGVFIREHAKAAALYNDIVVLYAYRDPSPQFWRLYRVSEGVEDGIRTVSVRYGGILAWLRDAVFGERRVKASQSSSTARQSTLLARLLTIPRQAIQGLLHDCSTFLAFRRLVREGWKPDVIHAHVFTAGVPAILMGRIHRIPVVITEHWNGFPLGRLTLVDRVRARFAMNRAQMILPVSAFLEAAIQRYGIKNRFRIVPNTVSEGVFHTSPSQTATRMNGPKRILLVALLSPQKGIPYLLEALCQLKGKRQDFLLDIVGGGPNSSEYQTLAATLGLDATVRFHGLKPKAEVAEFMRNCDFFVQPSLWETFGVVYVEAMFCGKPVLACRLPVLLDLVTEEVGILVPPRDVEALRDAIEYMLDNHHRYSPEKLASYAKQRFSYEAVGSMLNEVYQEVCRLPVVHADTSAIQSLD